VGTPNPSEDAVSRRRWRPRLLALHRDVGLLTVGLTLVYSLSGLAVNHRRDWDYERRTEHSELTLPPPWQLLPLSEARRRALEAAPASLTDDEARAVGEAVSARLGLPAPPRATLWRNPTKLGLFLGASDEDVADYDLATGHLSRLQRRPRLLLGATHRLHLNRLGGSWTWVADAFACGLAFMALSGSVLFLARQRRGRRAWLLWAAGWLIPLLALWLW